MLVAVHAGGELLSRLVERFLFGSPRQAFLELPEPGVDERPRLRIPVATTPMGDPTGGQVPAEVAGGELAAIVSAEGELTRPHAPGGHGCRDAGDRLVVAAAQFQRPAGDLSGAAGAGLVVVAPASSGARSSQSLEAHQQRRKVRLQY